MASINNGKTIYQLTSASALNDTDLFVISSGDNLTRSITLNQLKAAVTHDYFDKDETNELLDTLKAQIKTITDALYNSDINTSEFRNYVHTQLQEIKQVHLADLNNFRTEITNSFNSFENEVDEKFNQVNQRLTHLSDSVNTSVTNINSSIENLNTSITNLSKDTDTRIIALSKNVSDLNSKVDTDFNTLNSSINSTNTTLSKRISDLETNLTNKINSLFSYGTEVPTTLATGKIYFQYF